MRIPSSRDHEETHRDQAMTPMIDVVFLLLIFFVCASVGQLREALLPTKLEGGAVETTQFDEPPPEKPLGEVWLFVRHGAGGPSRVEVNEGGQTYDIAGENYARFRDVIRLLAEQSTGIPVILDIEPDVPMGDMIRVYDACYAAGFESVNFAIDESKVQDTKDRRVEASGR